MGEKSFQETSGGYESVEMLGEMMEVGAGETLVMRELVKCQGVDETPLGGFGLHDAEPVGVAGLWGWF